MTHTITIDRRKDTELRKQFDRAYNDLKDILPLYSEVERIEVIQGFLKAYNLLQGHDSAKGRLCYKLGVN